MKIKNVIDQLFFFAGCLISFFRILSRIAAGVPITSRKRNPDTEKSVVHLEQRIMQILAGSIAAQMCVPLDDYEFTRTCFHEAGHAVIAHHFGLAVDSAEVSEVGGITRYGPGPAGEVESLANSLAHTPTDETQISERVGGLIHCGRLPNLPDLEQETAKILASLWASVCRVARALYAKGSLTSAELEQLL